MEPTGVQKLVVALLLVAEKRGATHVRIKSAGTAAVIELWERGGWVESDLTDHAAAPRARQTARFSSA